MYESRPQSVIITLDGRLYQIPEVPPSKTLSLVSEKQCKKVINQMEKFVVPMIRTQDEEIISIPEPVRVLTT